MSVKSQIYRGLRKWNDADAILRGPVPAAKRFLVRKPLWRAFGRVMRRLG